MKDRSFSISDVLKEGWEFTKMNLGFFFVYQTLLLILFILFHYKEEGWTFSIPSFISWILIVLGHMGLYNSALLLTKGLQPSFDQFYKNWRLLFSWVIAGILFSLLLSMGLIFLIIPFFFIWTLFGLYPFFILDKDAGPIEALKKSFQATEGLRWELLFFFLTCMGLNLLGLILFGIGILITIPVTLIAQAVVYRIVTGQSKTSIQPDDIISHPSTHEKI